MLCRSLLHPIRTEVIVIGRRDRESLQYRNKKADSELYITTLFLKLMIKCNIERIYLLTIEKNNYPVTFFSLRQYCKNS